MMFINNYCIDFMFQEVMVCVTCSPSILSLIFFQFPFSFQDITEVCWILCPKFLVKKFIHKFKQNELYLENKKVFFLNNNNNKVYSITRYYIMILCVLFKKIMFYLKK